MKRINLSAKELILNPDLVNRAKKLGINLSDFTPLASKEKIVDGGKYVDGYEGSVGMEQGPKKKKSFASFFKSDGTDSAGGGSDFVVSDAMKYAAYAGMLSTANNIKPSRVPLEPVLPPSLYSKSYNVSNLLDQNKQARIGAMDFAKSRGANPLMAASAIHAQETENNLRIGTQVANFQNEVENKNTDIVNQYNQNRAKSLYNRTIGQMQENKYNAERTGAMKGEAIGGIINTATGAEQRAFDKRNYDATVKAGANVQRAASFVSLYANKLPQGIRVDAIFAEMNKGLTDDQIKAKYGL